MIHNFVSLHSTNKALAIFPVLYSYSVVFLQLISYIVVYTSYSPTPILPLPSSLSPLVATSLFSIPVSPLWKGSRFPFCFPHDGELKRNHISRQTWLTGTIREKSQRQKWRSFTWNSPIPEDNIKGIEMKWRESMLPCSGKLPRMNERWWMMTILFER